MNEANKKRLFWFILLTTLGFIFESISATLFYIVFFQGESQFVSASFVFAAIGLLAFTFAPRPLK